MKLQTKIPFTAAEVQIDYNSKVLLLGSCFTEHIGGKLEYYKFHNLQNPFGIIFHPKAMEGLLHRATHSIPFTEKDLFESEGRWHCLEVHSLVTHKDKANYLELLNGTLKELSKYIESASHIVITFGSAWGYRYKKSAKIVANCHKIPQKEFTRELSSVDEISAQCQSMIEGIRSLNKDVQLVFTVSPVRHLKDGFVENMRSKSHLVAGIHDYLASDPGASYFPSFEIMMDELRDYRFYSEDMLHPNATAVGIIWEHFSEVWIDRKTEAIQKEIASIRSGMAHKAFDPESASHKEFQKKLQQKIEQLQKKLPHLRF
jgi:lysophospholipase L1-like esterase